ALMARLFLMGSLGVVTMARRASERDSGNLRAEAATDIGFQASSRQEGRPVGVGSVQRCGQPTLVVAGNIDGEQASAVSSPVQSAEDDHAAIGRPGRALREVAADQQ